MLEELPIIDEISEPSEAPEPELLDELPPPELLEFEFPPDDEFEALAGAPARAIACKRDPSSDGAGVAEATGEGEGVAAGVGAGVGAGVSSCFGFCCCFWLACWA